MEAKDVVQSFEKFFLDIVGTVIPGALLLFVFELLYGDKFNLPSVITGQKVIPDWLFLIVASYVLGHVISGVSGNYLLPFVEYVFKRFYKLPIIGRCLENFYSKKIVTYKMMADNLENSSIYKTLLALVSKKIKIHSGKKSSAFGENDLRNLAISIAPEDSNIVYRFMFLGLLNQGVFTVAFLFVFNWAIAEVLSLFPSVLIANNISALWFWIAFVIMIICLERQYYFRNIAFKIPFSQAVAKLVFAVKKEGAFVGVDGLDGKPEKMRVYLAGGFKSRWQQKVKKIVKGCIYFDPSEHKIENPKQYTIWDLTAIRNCDIVFALFEESNPAGYALATEIGFAKALNKIVIFIDEKSKGNNDLSRYLELIRNTVDVTFTNFEEGVQYLKKVVEK